MGSILFYAPSGGLEEAELWSYLSEQSTTGTPQTHTHTVVFSHCHGVMLLPHGQSHKY